LYATRTVLRQNGATAQLSDAFVALDSKIEANFDALFARRRDP
jgi:hypothetical protein